MTRRLVPLVLAVLFAAGLVAAPPTAQEVRAALPDLTIVTTARYDVQPDDRRVRVTVDMTLHNRLRDTATRRYYFDRAFIAVLPGTQAFKVSSSGRRPTVRATQQNKDFTLLRINLGQRLFSGRTAKYRLTFELRDKGGSSTRDVRIGTSLASFPVWAFASDDTPGSRVTVVFPKGYTVEQETGTFPDPELHAETGRTIFRSGRLDDPLTFFAYFVADRPGAYEEQQVAANVGDTPVGVVVRSWPEDPEWAARIGGLFERALPVLGTRIGLGWPRDGGLVVQESVARSTGGYAGLFNPTSGEVEVAYYADDFVVLHEAAHTWFNGELIADRWALEGFASYYALEAAGELGIEATGDELTDELREARIPLNAWGPIGREERATEDYAYAATLAVARLIAERAGDEGLTEVWQAATDQVGAYQPPQDSNGATSGGDDGAAADPETVTGPPDWRTMLDLLEEHTDESYDDLWREWIIRPGDAALLTERETTRERYEGVVEQAAGWSLPRPIRDAMRAWQFDAATDLLDEADEILDGREEVDAAADEAGLTTPGTLRTAFEGDDGFGDARVQIDAQLETIDRYVQANETRPVNPDPLVQLGLWDTTPEADLATAAEAFAAGELEESATAADTARQTWLNAAQVGQGRALIIAAVVLGLLVALIAAIVALARRRTRRRAARLAFATTTGGDEVYTGPDAALADQVYTGPDASPAHEVYTGPDAARAQEVHPAPDTAPVSSDVDATQVHQLPPAPDSDQPVNREP